MSARLAEAWAPPPSNALLATPSPRASQTDCRHYPERQRGGFRHESEEIDGAVLAHENLIAREIERPRERPEGAIRGGEELVLDRTQIPTPILFKEKGGPASVVSKK